MALRRGFKSEANWYARELRRELGLEPADPIALKPLAAALGFRIRTLADYAEDHPEAVAYLRSVSGQAEFSAVTVCVAGKRIVIVNDAHGAKRCAANIAHELAHGVLNHPPAETFNAVGARTYNAEQEEEAKWLGPALLVSEEAALLIVERGWSSATASNRYGASEEVVRMRLNVTGAFKRARAVV